MNEANNDKKVEISFRELFQIILKSKKALTKFALIFLLIGVIFAISAPKEYTVTITMIPQSNNSVVSKLGGLSSIASMAGINFNSINTSEDLPPVIYPNIVQSLPFQMELLNTKFILQKAGKPISLIEYYKDYEKSSASDFVIKYTVFLPSMILGAIRTEKQTTVVDSSMKSFITITKDFELLREKIMDNIKLQLNDKDGLMFVKATFQDPYLCAQVARKTQEMLQEYVTKYKIEKAQAQLKFIEERYQEVKSEFESTQRKLSYFRDNNKFLSTSTAKNEEEKLQSEYNISFTMYSELAKQLEQAKVKVKEDTPILTVIDPAKVPYKRSAPNRIMIIFTWTFLGVVIGIILAFIKHFSKIINLELLESK